MFGQCFLLDGWPCVNSPPTFGGAEPQQNIQIPEHANRALPIWLFDARLSINGRLTSSCPGAILVPPLPTKSRQPSTSHSQQVQHARSHGQVRRAHKFNANKREIHLIEVKYAEDTRPGHQLEASNNSTKFMQVLKS